MNLNKTHKANIKVHSELLEKGIYQTSIHKSKRNKIKLSQFLNRFKKNNLTHLDCGCGDGFVFDCSPHNFLSYGVDITDAMLAECKKKFPKVFLKKALVEKLPFDNNFFDLSTSYSFLDHLKNREKYYLEVYRTLKFDGIFFSGLIPNFYFYNTFILKKKFNNSILPKNVIDDELLKAYSDGDHYHEQYNINRNDLDLCEPGKSIENGINPYIELKILEKIGFKEIEIEFDWIVGENFITDKTLINNIYEASDLCSSAFKYFNIYAKK
jgi:SAM-dependent methyltransferase